jgi:hypothetical protein
VEKLLPGRRRRNDSGGCRFVRAIEGMPARASQFVGKRACVAGCSTSSVNSLRPNYFFLCSACAAKRNQYKRNLVNASLLFIIVTSSLRQRTNNQFASSKSLSNKQQDHLPV